MEFEINDIRDTLAVICGSKKSFDIFDTLLARTVKVPTDIFTIIERTFPYPQFAQLRQRAQNMSNQTIGNIYEKFKQITGESDDVIDRLKQFELQTEMENTIPIGCNISNIRPGDIFISDMYLAESDIVALLTHHGIQEPNQPGTVFVSPSGKSTGTMWKTVLSKYRLSLHTGDNMHSDINMAIKYGIPAKFTTVHKFSYLEDALVNQNFELCKLLRTFRLKNTWAEDSTEYTIYDQQIRHNIPILLFMCKQLANILVQENRTTVLFFTRDGCLIYKLFSALYPQYNSIYLQSSRIINENYNQDYIAYLKSVYVKDKCIMFDLHGSFSTGRKMFMAEFGHLPRIFIFDTSKLAPHYDGMTTFAQLGNRLEMLNPDTIGTLVNFIGDVGIRKPSDHNLTHAQIAHTTVDEFIRYTLASSENVDCVTSPIFNDCEFWMNFYSRDLYPNHAKIFTQKNESLVLTNLTELANKYKSDKGNAYKCAHHYTLIYEQIIHYGLTNKLQKPESVCRPFELLEIGLNRDNTNTIPSLMVWYDYFFQINVHITGFDIQQEFKKFIGTYPTIDIVIGDQSKPNDLAPLKHKLYDLIIDDGYHASKHQQISFMELWENVVPGGYYVIEDLHYQPEPETCVKTKALFENWSSGNWISTEYIDGPTVNKLKETIDSIAFYDSASTKWGNSVKHALVYIKKAKV
jgi:hypothetical protein